MVTVSCLEGCAGYTYIYVAGGRVFYGGYFRLVYCISNLAVAVKWAVDWVSAITFLLVLVFFRVAIA